MESNLAVPSEIKLLVISILIVLSIFLKKCEPHKRTCSSFACVGSSKNWRACNDYHYITIGKNGIRKMDRYDIRNTIQFK